MLKSRGKFPLQEEKLYNVFKLARFEGISVIYLTCVFKAAQWMGIG